MSGNQQQQEGAFKKDLRKIDIWSLALGAIIGWGCFVMPGTSFLPKAGPIGSIIGLMLGAVIMCIICISYGYMIRKFPLSGGEFVYADTAFGKKTCFYLWMVHRFGILVADSFELYRIGNDFTLYFTRISFADWVLVYHCRLGCIPW